MKGLDIEQHAKTFGQGERSKVESFADRINRIVAVLEDEEGDQMSKQSSENLVKVVESGLKTLRDKVGNIVLAPENGFEQSEFLRDYRSLAVLNPEEVGSVVSKFEFERMVNDFELPESVTAEELRSSLFSQLILYQIAVSNSSNQVANIDIARNTQDGLPEKLKADDFYVNPLMLLLSHVEPGNGRGQITHKNSLANQKLAETSSSYVVDPISKMFVDKYRIGSQFVTLTEDVFNSVGFVGDNGGYGLSNPKNLVQSWVIYQKALKDGGPLTTINLHHGETLPGVNPESIKSIFAVLSQVKSLKDANRIFKNNGLKNIGLVPDLRFLLENGYIGYKNSELNKVVQTKVGKMKEANPVNFDYGRESDLFSAEKNNIANTLLPSFEDPRFDPRNFGNLLQQSFEEWKKANRQPFVTELGRSSTASPVRPIQGKGVDVPESLKEAFSCGVLNVGDGLNTPEVAINFSTGEESETKRIREEVESYLKKTDIFVIEPFVSEMTTADVAEYAQSMIGGRKDRVYAVDNNRGINPNIKERTAQVANIVSKNASLNKLDWERIVTDFNLPENIVDKSAEVEGQPKIHGLKGAALYAGLIEIAVNNPDISDDAMVTFVDSDYENSWDYNPILHAGLAMMHADQNNFQLNGYNMAKAGAGRNNVSTHQAYASLMNSSDLQEFSLGVAGSSLVWPHSDSFAIRWGVLKKMPIAMDMDIEHILKTCLLLEDVKSGEKKFWQVVNDIPKIECADSDSEREWTMMKGLASHLESFIQIAKENGWKYGDELVKSFNDKHAGRSKLNTLIGDYVPGSATTPMSNSQGYLAPSIETLINGGYLKD